jgi:biotin carboxyl carrier protein
VVACRDQDPRKGGGDVAEHIMEAPAPGKILKVYVEPGTPVAEGDRVFLMEALKMELQIVAPASGRLKALRVAAGQNVEAGDPLAVIEE